MGLLNQLVVHGLNCGSHLAQRSGHETVSGVIDGVLRSSGSKFVRECTQDRRFERSRADLKIHHFIQHSR